VYKIQCNFESGSVKFSVILKTHLATLLKTQEAEAWTIEIHYKNIDRLFAAVFIQFLSAEAYLSSAIIKSVFSFSI